MSGVPPVDLRPARDRALAEWVERRSFRGGDFAVADLVARKTVRVSVVLPSRRVAGTIGGVLDALAPLAEAGLLDELLVVDAASEDGTIDAAEGARGVRVAQESEILPGFGPARGKGDAMWRGLAATEGDLVMYLDTDTEDFDPSFAVGLLGPLIADPDLALVKAAYRRPFRRGDQVTPDEGGRVTELVGPAPAQPGGARAGRLPAAAGRRDGRAPGAARARCPSRSATGSRSRC